MVTGTWEDLDFSGTVTTTQNLAVDQRLVMRLNATVSGVGSPQPSIQLIVGGSTGASLSIGVNPEDVVININETDPICSPITALLYLNITGVNSTVATHTGQISNILGSFANKSKAETITGAWNFSAAADTTFNTGNVLFYSPAFFLNNVSLTQTGVLSVNTSVLLRNIGGTLIGNWSDNGGSARFWTDGNIVITGSIDSLTTNGIRTNVSALQSVLGTVNSTVASLLTSNTSIWTDLNNKWRNITTINTTLQYLVTNNVSTNTRVTTLNTTIQYLVLNNQSALAGIGTVNTTAVNAGNVGASLNITKLNATGSSANITTLNVTTQFNLGKAPPFYIWYYNATVWDCYNGTGTLYNRGNGTLTC
jgi:hypothetical protein